MMIEADILKALQTAAIAAYAASPLCAAPYNWPSDGKGRIKPAGITFNPPDNDARWIEFVNIVNNRDNDYWDDGRVYQGNFRVILHWPPDEAGAYVPMRIMDDLAGRFPKGVLLRQGNAVVQIYGVPLASGVIENGSELLLPVALPYRCWKA